ncbi:toprim domain-containing protein, partial [Candidatus Neomarinimicrobiota bacterium]
MIWHKAFQFPDSRASLFPLNLLGEYSREYVVICEGLSDCISLLSVGIQTITSTGGATGIPADISALEGFRRIYLVMDNDAAGDRGLDLWANVLLRKNPTIKARACDLSEYAEIGGDVTDYLSIPGKNGRTFIDEILTPARFARPFSDRNDFISHCILNDPRIKALDDRSFRLLVQLILRVVRHRTTNMEVQGLETRVKPGEYLTSYEQLAKLHPDYDSHSDKRYTREKARTDLSKLKDLGFIRSRLLGGTRPQIVELVDWKRSHSGSHSNNGDNHRPEYPLFLSGYESSVRSE